MTQVEYLSKLLDENQDATIIGSLGTISYNLTDVVHPDKILVRGAMGAVLGVGLGYALARPDRKVIVVIGDGSFLMKMGSIATIMKKDLKNLQIHVINNCRHMSTGGQKTSFTLVRNLVEGVVRIIDVKEESTL